ncbi:hypothetical protein F5B20DRAFT_532630 [Whalleya microplaca]|nr:hypothetical protein F5B20DRAFT_532630 [Whalleya microplaca]
MRSDIYLSYVLLTPASENLQCLFGSRQGAFTCAKGYSNVTIMRVSIHTALLRPTLFIRPRPACLHARALVSSLSNKMDLRINQILDFWFGLSPATWFEESTEELDRKIRVQFTGMVKEARASKFDDTWSTTPQGTLALLILLDQFPRNIFRGSGESFTSDKHAQCIATRAISKEYDRQITSVPGGTLFHRLFFYLPLLHAEDLLSQVAAVALAENLLGSCPPDAPERKFLDTSPSFMKRHRDCIAQLGRFPKRNAWLGRESTDEEIKFLDENPGGF